MNPKHHMEIIWSVNCCKWWWVKTWFLFLGREITFRTVWKSKSVCNFTAMVLSGVLTFSTFPSAPSDEGPFFTSSLSLSLSLRLCVSLLSWDFYTVCNIISAVLSEPHRHIPVKKKKERKLERLHCHVWNAPLKCPAVFSAQMHRNSAFIFHLPLSFLRISVFVFYSPSLRKREIS